MDIAEVRAAINNKKKNIDDQIVPPAISGKTDGKITKINPGPEAGSAPNAKTVVKIATPANIAIAVSKKITHNAEERRF